MKEVITISAKGQVVIPKKIREKAGLEAGDQMLVEWDGSRLVFSKIETHRQKPSSGVVKELLGKYRKADEQEQIDVRKFRETLYGKIDD